MPILNEAEIYHLGYGVNSSTLGTRPLCLNSEAEIRLCLFSDFHCVCAIEQQDEEIDMQSLEDSLEEHDKRKAAIGSSGMTPQKKMHASRLPERKIDPLNLPNLQLVVKSNLKAP